MKKITNQFNGSHADRINNGGGRFRRIALFPLMLLMLLLVPTSMVAQTDYDNTVTFTALAGSPEGMSEAENYHKLFDGQKKEGNSTKWCCKISGSANVIFAASKAGVPVGYTITTGNDNSNWNGRNPKSWKLYGNNAGKDGEWTLIQEVNNDTKLQDVNCTSYDFTCEKGKTSYQYFKWEISAIQSGDVLQVGEFELKLQTCTHTNADGSSALGDPIENVEATCTEHGYTTYKCSICHSTVKEYKTDELKKHTLTHHEATNVLKEHWQCDVCHKYFSDANATQEVNYASLLYQAYAVFDQTSKTLTFSYGAKPEGAYDLNEGTNSPAWREQGDNIETVVFDASFANARPTSCFFWFLNCSNLTTIEGIEYLNTENVTNMNSMFYCCSALESLNLTNFNTENVTDMSNMFHGCSALTSLDLSNFNTAKVKEMGFMFNVCTALTTIYASDKFVTNQVTYGIYMFYGCTALKGAIDYDANKTSHTYANCDTGYFTPGCAYAEFDESTGTLTFKCGLSKPEGAYDLNEGDSGPAWSKQSAKINKVVFDASFANARPTSCKMWFYNCNNLTEIEGIENLNTVNVTDMNCMFWGCSSLTSLDLSKFDTQKVTDMGFMFSYSSNLTSLDLSKFDTQNVTNMVYMFSGCSKLTLLNLSKFNTQNLTSMTHMFSCCAGLNSLDLSKFDTQNVTDMEGMFDGCSGFTSLDLSKFDTQKVTNMRYMFNGCSALTSLDLSKFNTQKVTDMTNMFYGCSDLTTIYVSDKFVTTNVNFGYSMFEGCTSLKGAIVYDANKIDHAYANYNTGYFTLKPSTAYAVFNEVDGTLTFRYDDSKPAGAYDLNEGANVPAWIKKDWIMNDHIKNVVFDASFANARPTSCNMWFIYCNNLTKIEGIENLNTVNVTGMYGMFYGCSGLTSLDLSKFNTQNVTSMSNMFSGCSALTSLDLSKFDTQNVTEMNEMFDGCSGLTSLDLSKFDTQNVTDMPYMFSGCSALTTIYVSDKFVTTKVSDGSEMFEGCTSLKGAIDFDDNKTDHTYANYKTGYFTKLVGKNGNDKIGAVGEVLTAESLALADDKDFEAYEPFTAKTATYTRTLKEGTSWATLCLPFEVSLADQNFRAFELLSADETTNTVELKEIETSIAAGTPVIIKMKEGQTALNISVANKEIANNVKTAATVDGSYQLQGLYTKKVFDKVADNNCYIVKGDKLMNPTKLLENTSTTQVGSKPFRAYMVDNTSSSAGAKMFSIAIGDNTTAIDSLNTIADDKAVYYDLQGNRLSAPQKGINIVKRGSKTMKVIIK
ncbi:BspA family leucine-rich repeat surface protein [Segatella copri]|uniref:BspA family leucine-rich repeat surface protein n=1 Tax=Segatella copri TaxID=165179 RepID=UPI00293AAEB1|nr:BspA family leucine-rich repeat surface protein [Segatella copri]MDV3107803.1 BspA family leucine-rich repeat surface protein [Segatella copri]WOF88845.1 BspA family leucine-rich repeat surface protein [Segatella copri]WOF94988.1 BspA family leucine-rich repeat surface protein [Segatella copri]